MRIFTVVAFLFSSICYGQSETAALPTDRLITEPIKKYKEATFLTQNLYNGRAYYMYDSKMEEHQFFVDRKWARGSVYYNDQLFENVEMLYDIVKDELVIHHLNGDNLLLQTERIDYFDVLDHHYKRLIAGKDIPDGMRTGFYDIVYNGNTKLIVRRRKERQEKIVERQVISLFPQKDFYYLYKDGTYRAVRSKKSVLALFPQNGKELRRAVRAEHIPYRKNRETAIKIMAAKYDQLAK